MSTPSRCTGVVAAACTQGKRTQHGKPQCVIRDDQPDAREGQAGRVGVAERPVIPMKPGNAGGGKEPQFKTGARRGEGPGDWATWQLRRVFRNGRRRYTRKRRRKPAIGSTSCTTSSAVTGRAGACMTAPMRVLAPIFEADFPSFSMITDRSEVTNTALVGVDAFAGALTRGSI